MYFDQNATQLVRDNWEPSAGAPDAYEGPGAGGEVIAKRYLYNPEHATKTYEGVTLSAYQDDAITDLKYALDEGGQPGAFVDILNLPDGDYATPFPVWVKVIFAPTGEPLKRTHIKHWIQAQREILK